MPSFDFDTPINRQQSGSVKWSHADADVISMWIADMDFAVAPAIRRALRKRIDHAIYGYQFDGAHLRHVLVDRLEKRHMLPASPDEIVFMPGLVMGLNLVSRIVGAPKTGVVTLTPIYPPFLLAPTNSDKTLITVPLSAGTRDGHLHYEIDFDRLEFAITHADVTPSLFMLCNPHNPVGRAYTEAELSSLAELCLRHNLIICADEIHADLTLGKTQHISMASLSTEVARRTITLLAPSKAFNIPGLGLGFAHILDPDLRSRIVQMIYSLGAFTNVFGYVAAEAAYTEGDRWLKALNAYLLQNRELLVEYVEAHLPGVRITQPEATYLAWLDCREAMQSAGIDDKPYRFFLDKAKVWLNDGGAYGNDGEGFVRLNFGCPRARLVEALDRLRDALAQAQRAPLERASA
jgi:cystathionine beta-lyase